jgi:hypothetical protein
VDTKSILGWSWKIALAAAGPAALWASPWGPARDLKSALELFFLGYPAWLILCVWWLVPGLLLAWRFRWKHVWALPTTAVLVEFLWSAWRHWPPDRWWPMFEAGQPEVPSGYLFGYAYEAWDHYAYSLRARCILALVAALSLLVVIALQAKATKPRAA